MPGAGACGGLTVKNCLEQRMNKGVVELKDGGLTDLTQPNAFDRKQIERAIAKRTRYRYVRPNVRAEAGGILVDSPCCSRRIDSDGGVVDIAFVQYLASGDWQLYSKDHSAGKWKLHGVYQRLTDLLEPLKDDPEGVFWQ
jgi:Protein of unknown function (DUF3024)